MSVYICVNWSSRCENQKKWKWGINEQGSKVCRTGKHLILWFDREASRLCIGAGVRHERGEWRMPFSSSLWMWSEGKWWAWCSIRPEVQQNNPRLIDRGVLVLDWPKKPKEPGDARAGVPPSNIWGLWDSKFSCDMSLNQDWQIELDGLLACASGLPSAQELLRN